MWRITAPEPRVGPTLWQQGSALSRSAGLWMSSPSPDASCQWGMLTLLDGAVCVPRPAPVWLVVFISGFVIVPRVENSVWSTSRYTPRPLLRLRIKERWRCFYDGWCDVSSHIDEAWTSWSQCVFNALHGLCFVTCGKERWALLLENLSGLERQDVCILLKLAFVTFHFFKL